MVASRAKKVWTETTRGDVDGLRDLDTGLSAQTVLWLAGGDPSNLGGRFGWLHGSEPEPMEPEPMEPAVAPLADLPAGSALPPATDLDPHVAPTDSARDPSDDPPTEPSGEVTVEVSEQSVVEASAVSAVPSGGLPADPDAAPSTELSTGLSTTSSTDGSVTSPGTEPSAGPVWPDEPATVDAVRASTAEAPADRLVQESADSPSEESVPGGISTGLSTATDQAEPVEPAITDPVAAPPAEAVTEPPSPADPTDPTVDPVPAETAQTDEAQTDTAPVRAARSSGTTGSGRTGGQQRRTASAKGSPARPKRKR